MPRPYNNCVMSEENIKTHVRMLAGEIGERNVDNPDAYREAERYIDQTWRSCGYDVACHAYEAGGVECVNLEVTQPGERDPDKIIIIGAHYDTVAGSPGANDNGSGVAALLELSRRFSDARPGLSVRFVAFANEEPPFFHTRKRGSRVYAKMARKRGDDIIGMMALETIGFYTDRPGSQEYPPFMSRFYPDTGNYVAFVSNLRSVGWLKRTAAAFRERSSFPAESLAMFTPVAPGAAWSDHSSFWENGFHALMVTDTAFYRYPYYHTPHDTPDRLTYGALARVTDGLYEAILALAEMDHES